MIDLLISAAVGFCGFLCAFVLAFKALEARRIRQAAPDKETPLTRAAEATTPISEIRDELSTKPNPPTVIIDDRELERVVRDLHKRSGSN